MSDLIRKADVQKILKALYDNRQYSDVTNTLFVAMENIHDLPTVDAVEVVHGEWEQLCDPSFSTNFPTISRCTACGMKYNLPNISYNYCPRCGAKMDGGDK